VGAGVNRDRVAETPRWPVTLLAATALAAAVAGLLGHRGHLPPAALEPRPIDLDRADPVDLDLLPGIGPALAARIVADRDERGPFGSPDGLLRVRGIGPATVEGVRPFVRGGRTPDRDDG
jgi:DNA uptake protein ComE-like DNA-binding protein